MNLPSRMYADNILIALEPRETKSEGGIIHPGFEYKGDDDGRGNRKKSARDPRSRPTGTRWARVLLAGPGYHAGCKKCGAERCTFIPTTLKPGDRILVSEVSGHAYDLDIKGVRQRDRTESFEAGAFGDVDANAEFRVIREDEACLIDDSANAPQGRLVPRWPSEDSGVE